MWLPRQHLFNGRLRISCLKISKIQLLRTYNTHHAIWTVACKILIKNHLERHNLHVFLQYVPIYVRDGSAGKPTSSHIQRHIITKKENHLEHRATHEKCCFIQSAYQNGILPAQWYLCMWGCHGLSISAWADCLIISPWLDYEKRVPVLCNNHYRDILLQENKKCMVTFWLLFLKSYLQNIVHGNIWLQTPS